MGGSRMIRIREVIAILDAGFSKRQSLKVPLIEAARREGGIEQISPEETKSYVITSDRVYASPISSITLKKRAQMSQKPLK
nr:DUF370 domain-containing protein [Paenactinomyces guangxiensis]